MIKKEGWEKKKLGDLCEVITKGTTPTSLGYNFTQEGVNFIKLESLTEKGEIIPNKVAYISEACHQALKRSQLKVNDILFSIAGALGRIGIVKEDIVPANTNQALAIIRLKKETGVSTNYVSKFFTSNIIIREIEKLKGGVAQQNLSLGQLNSLEIPIPPLSLQHQIVSELDTLIDIITKKNQQLADLDTLAQSTFYEMFGDPVNNEKGWEVRKLKDITTKINSGNTPKGGNNVYVENGITFFRSQNVWKNNLVYDDIAFIDKQTHLSMMKSSLKHKDILMTKTGRINTENSSLGRAALFLGDDDTANINGHVYLIRLKKQQVHKYVVHILTSKIYRDLIRKVCVGGIDKRQLNKNHIEEFPIIYPPIENQHFFAEKIESIEKQKELINKSITDVQQLFDYTMDKYFN